MNQTRQPDARIADDELGLLAFIENGDGRCWCPLSVKRSEIDSLDWPQIMREALIALDDEKERSRVG